MENKIRLLPEIVANQIAAGEVVESPSSVVKEMMENSIDAGATSVTVNFRNAGLELIQIVDNGCGMSPMDARMAFDRHATSKIRDFDDVYRLQTFGFRGEALASIAAVAQVELRTRQAEDEVGTVTIVNGGEFISQSPVMCPVGSQFLVRNLFYTAPARRKFSSDRSKIITNIKKEFRRVALCNPQVKCELMSNDMSIISLPAGSLSERIIDVVGRHIKTNLLDVSVETSIVNIKGYVGRPSAAKQKNQEQYLFVNGRYFRSPQIYHSIMRAYEKLIPENCSPSYFLYLTVDPERVDVNVSPHKTEVRFADNDDVNQIIHAAVRSTLAKSGSVGMMDFDNNVAIEIPALDKNVTVYAEPSSSSKVDYNPFSEDYASVDVAMAGDIDLSTYDVPYDGEAMQSVGTGKSTSRSTHSSNDGVGGLRNIAWSAMSFEKEFDIEVETKPAEESYREFFSGGIIGDAEQDDESNLEFIESSASVQQTLLDEEFAAQEVMSLGNGYAVAMCSGRSMVVELSRAKERVLFEGLMQSVRGAGVPSQRLLFPEKLTLSIDDYQLLEEHLVEFAALGFDMELVGDGNVDMNGVPSSMVGEPVDRLLYDLLREVEQSGAVAERIREDMVRLMAVKGSRRVGRGMTSTEAHHLVDDLLRCENYSFSPSGKPIISELTAEELKLKLS
ncbi:MAG: DNA mismatch repair endonuclease MutL [Alistipes sp.]|nr:DNA mismatch repair endonuclease MutL [Alistipes sp.]